MQVPSVNNTLRNLAVALLLLLTSEAARSQSLQGTWQGTLSGPGGSLPLIFDLTTDGSGTFKSPMQNLEGSANYTSSGNTIAIKIPFINATYHGRHNGTQLIGTWSQGLVRLPLRLDKVSTVPTAAVPVPSATVNSKPSQPPGDSGVSGHWIGRLVGSGYDWPLHLWLNAAGSGNASSTTGGFDAVASYTISGNQLTLSVQKIHASIQATLTPGSISGTWSQNGASLPINMTRQHFVCPPASSSLSWSEADCKASIEAAKGTWNGILLQSTGVTRFKLDLHEDGSGDFTSATSNDQAKLGYYLGPNQISIAIPSINGKIVGAISSGKFSISDLDLGSLQTDPGSIQCTITRADTADADSQKIQELQKYQAAISGKSSPSDNPTLLGLWQGKLTTEVMESPFILQFQGFGYGSGGSNLPIAGPFKYTFNGNKVSVLFFQSNATFEGTFDNHQMNGTITFSGKDYPLTLAKP